MNADKTVLDHLTERIIGSAGWSAEASEKASGTQSFTECTQSFTERRFYWRFAQVIVDINSPIRGCVGWLRAQRNHFFSP
jgi:hypothetical protein